jgi:hemerythrin-like domain-containing protein
MSERMVARRHFLILAGGLATGAGLLRASPPAWAAAGSEAEAVTANEDLMREHGLIRRILLVYQAAARRARSAPTSLPLGELGAAADLMRRFGEDYHEHALEEVHIFPVVRKIYGPVAKLPDTLERQHRRGREITGYVQRIAAKPSLSAAAAEPLARTLEAFVRMYEPHAAREDTELFPAWKAALCPAAYAEMGERFEEIERKTFGGDGFEDALGRIARIEAAFGVNNLAAATASPPPAG